MAIHSSIARGKTQTNPRSRSSWTLAWLAAAALTALGQLGVSCSKDVARGGVGQDCYPNGTCNPGLSCYSNLCVDARTAAGSGGGGGAAGGGATGSTAGAVGSAGGVGGGAGMGGAGKGGASGASGGKGGGIAGAGGDGARGGVGGGIGGIGGQAGTGGGIGGQAGTGGGIGGQAGTGAGGVDAGRDASACVVVDAGPGEGLAVGACGYNPTTTTGSYGGVVTLTVSGVITNAPASSLMDAFYLLDPTNTSVAIDSCPFCLRYNRSSEAACVCSTECSTTSHPVPDVLLGPYPPFNPAHVYTVQLDLGAGASAPLRFGMYDCGCNDNSGTWAVTVQQAVCGS